MRKAAADALIAMGPAVIPEITRVMEAENRDLFHWAMRILAALADPSAVDPLITYLAKCRDGDRRESIVRALGGIGGERAVDALLDLLSDESWTMRKCAAESLVAMGERVLPAVAARYSDGNADVRYWVVRVAGEIRQGGGAAVALRALDDPEWFVRSCAATACGEIGDPKAVKPLLSRLFDDNPEVRKNASLALERIAGVDPAAASLELESAARTADADVAASAEEYLERLAAGEIARPDA